MDEWGGYASTVATAFFSTPRCALLQEMCEGSIHAAPQPSSYPSTAWVYSYSLCLLFSSSPLALARALLLHAGCCEAHPCCLTASRVFISLAQEVVVTPAGTDDGPACVMRCTLPPSDARSIHAAKVLGAKPGDALRVGVLNGSPATATVVVRRCTLTSP